jgi:hypothetical protein
MTGVQFSHCTATFSSSIVLVFEIISKIDDLKIKLEFKISYERLSKADLREDDKSQPATRLLVDACVEVSFKTLDEEYIDNWPLLWSICECLLIIIHWLRMILLLVDDRWRFKSWWLITKVFHYNFRIIFIFFAARKRIWKKQFRNRALIAMQFSKNSAVLFAVFIFQLLHVHGKVRSYFVIGNSFYKIKQKNGKHAFILLISCLSNTFI